LHDTFFNVWKTRRKTVPAYFGCNGVVKWSKSYPFDVWLMSNRWSTTTSFRLKRSAMEPTFHQDFATTINLYSKRVFLPKPKFKFANQYDNEHRIKDTLQRFRHSVRYRYYEIETCTDNNEAVFLIIQHADRWHVFFTFEMQIAGFQPLSVNLTNALFSSHRIRVHSDYGVINTAVRRKKKGSGN
jgi:hypothetical protein